MRKTSASKERHEGCLERLYALKEVGKSPFPTDGIPYQRPEKLAENDVAPEAASCNSRESRGQHMRQN